MVCAAFDRGQRELANSTPSLEEKNGAAVKPFSGEQTSSSFESSRSAVGCARVALPSKHASCRCRWHDVRPPALSGHRPVGLLSWLWAAAWSCRSSQRARERPRDRDRDGGGGVEGWVGGGICEIYKNDDKNPIV